MTDFETFFTRATGHTPYAYQRELGARDRPPSVIEVPTGSGKTDALLLPWLHARLERREGPRRLVYALPMRTLVEQTTAEVTAIRQRLGLSADDVAVHVLMGGREPEGDWRSFPERPQVLVGTIDMLLSRALNRGYSESRFAWPVSFGLLNADCRWVFDEVQLMGPARATSAQLDGFRASFGTAFPCETVWVSATIDRSALATVDRPELGEVLTLPDADRRGTLAARLEATKLVQRVDLTGGRSADQPRQIAQAVLAAHTAGTRSIVVLNTVERAQALAKALRRAAGDVPVVLLHSRFRPPERALHLAEALADVDPGGPGLIVVSTQVIEAGVDVSSRLLATETAPFSSIVQRLGRCNRAGEHAQAEVLWLDAGDLDRKAAAPYSLEDLAHARRALEELVGRSASPATLETLEVPESRVEPDVLRRRDLLDLFDTAPDLSGLDVDVSRFIRSDDERNVSVFFRDLPEGTPAADEPRPDRDELVSVPIHQIRDRADVAWLFDHVDRHWVRARSRPIRPGELVLLDAAGGGYDSLDGWSPASKVRVEAWRPDQSRAPEGIEGDDETFVGEWQSLGLHLDDTRRAAHELAAALDLTPEDAAAVMSAAALHDVGKSHPMFQAMLLSTLDEAERDGYAGDVWAKSASRSGGRHVRRFFRHELASALAVRGLTNGAASDLDRRDLVVYLIGAHHGRVRVSIRPAPEERPPADAPDAARFALGVAEGDRLPSVATPLGELPAVELTLACMELGGEERSWTDVACSLRDDPALGPFRLAYLEALVRVADWRASDR
jgi:CRISPR-associated endonuclease/helicase Cas3